MPEIDNSLKFSSYAGWLSEVHDKWTPHAGQIAAAKPLINEKTKDCFWQCGRNWGKSDLVSYLLWRWGLLKPGTENYYFAPYRTQAKEIIWASQRMQGFGPRDAIAKVNDSELRITFKNGSFIKVDGSDNYEAYRGIKPKGLVILDEFKDFRPEFYTVFNPNRQAHNIPMVVCGTPPDRDCQYTQLAQEYKDTPDKQFYVGTCRDNPHLDHKELDKTKDQLYARGEGDVWEREYEAKFVRGGAAKLFPMLADSMIKPHDEIMTEIGRDRKRLEWLVWADPAAASCFGILFAALNPYTRHWYVLDEIYEKSQAEMSVVSIGNRCVKMRADLNERYEWRTGYDEANPWFANEMIDHFDEHWEPSHKQSKPKEVGLSLMKDLMLHGKLTISDRCSKFFWELDNYVKDKNGRIPKVNDHLIDAFRYMLNATQYDLNEAAVPIPFEKTDEFRGARPEDDVFEDRKELDWTSW